VNAQLNKALEAEIWKKTKTGFNLANYNMDQSISVSTHNERSVSVCVSVCQCVYRVICLDIYTLLFVHVCGHTNTMYCLLCCMFVCMSVLYVCMYVCVVCMYVCLCCLLVGGVVYA
jgi:hypothetical protein